MKASILDRTHSSDEAIESQEERIESDSGLEEVESIRVQNLRKRELKVRLPAHPSSPLDQPESQEERIESMTTWIPFLVLYAFTNLRKRELKVRRVDEAFSAARSIMNLRKRELKAGPRSEVPVGRASQNLRKRELKAPPPCGGRPRGRSRNLRKRELKGARPDHARGEGRRVESQEERIERRLIRG